MITLFNKGSVEKEYIQIDYENHHQDMVSRRVKLNENLIPISLKRKTNTSYYNEYFVRKNDLAFNNLKDNKCLLKLVDLDNELVKKYFTDEQLQELKKIQNEVVPGQILNI